MGYTIILILFALDIIFKATLYFEFVIFLVQHVYYQFDVMHTLKSYGNVQITVKIIKLQLIKCINKA